MKKPDICQICLRLDRELKVVDQVLTDFHDELCDYVLDPLNSQYCFECAYLLKKMYNFQIRCKNAIVVFKKWKNTKGAQKKPAHLLYTLLPPTSLGLWTPDNNKVYTFTSEDQEPEPSIHFESSDCTLQNNEIKTEMECEDDSEQNSHNLHSLHTQILKNFEEVTVNDGNFDNKEQLHDNDILLDDDDIKKEVDLNDFPVSDDDEDVNNKSGDINSRSVANDHCYTKEIEEQKGCHKRKSLTELANISFSDDEFICDDETEANSDMGDSVSESFSDDDEEESQKSTRKKNIDKGDTKSQRKIINNKINAKSGNRNKRTGSKKVANIELLNMTINEDNETIKLKRPPFSKERLITKLEKKFAVVGEIKTSDGATIDKQFILTCLNEKANEFTLRLLSSSIQGRLLEAIKPCALKLFRDIHNKYKNDHQLESVFDIEYLNTEEKVRAEFERRKTYECYAKARYKCEICYQGFKHEKLLEYHRKYHGESAGSVVCTVCSVYCKKVYIEGHMKICHEAVYKCKLCPLVTYRRTSMINHYDQHQGKQYVCELCGTSYKSLSTYLSHRGAVHSTQHVCTLCGRSLYSEIALKAHKTRMHPDHTLTDREVKCSECDSAFASQEVYLRHVRNAHNGLLPNGTRVPRLKGQPRRMPKKYVIACRVCNATGNSYGWLTFHFRMKHPTVDVSTMYMHKHKHLCHICGKGFKVSRMLQDHMNHHTGTLPYTCAVCPKRFHSYAALARHKQMHLPPSKACQDCGKKFKTQSNLYNHQRIHVRDRRYKCSICGKGFLHSSSLTAHVRGVHNNERRAKKKRVTEPRETKKARTKNQSD